MQRPARHSYLSLAAIAAVSLLFATSAAAAAAPSVNLRLTGAHAKKNARCVHENHPALRSASQVKRNAALTLAGSVSPTPTHVGWQVSLVVKRCGAAGPGEYKKVWSLRVAGTSTGTFRAAYTPRSPGLYYAVASYGKRPSTDSRKLYFLAN